MDIRLRKIARIAGHLFNFTKGEPDEFISEFLERYAEVINTNGFDYNSYKSDLSGAMSVIVDKLCSSELLEEAKEFLKLICLWNLEESFRSGTMDQIKHRKLTRLQWIFESL